MVLHLLPISLFIQLSTYITHDKYVDPPVKTFSSCHYLIQCKILFENCNGWQVLGSCIKLVSEALSSKTYAVLAERVQLMLRESFVGIKICSTILIDLQLGHFQNDRNYQNIKIPIEQRIMEYATKGWSFLIAVFSKEKIRDLHRHYK